MPPQLVPVATWRRHPSHRPDAARRPRRDAGRADPAVPRLRERRGRALRRHETPPEIANAICASIDLQSGAPREQPLYDEMVETLAEELPPPRRQRASRRLRRAHGATPPPLTAPRAESPSGGRQRGQPRDPLPRRPAATTRHARGRGAGAPGDARAPRRRPDLRGHGATRRARYAPRPSTRCHTLPRHTRGTHRSTRGPREAV